MIAVLGHFRLKSFCPTVASRASKMAITRSRHVEMRGNPDHLIRNFALFNFVGCSYLDVVDENVEAGIRTSFPDVP